ncbi:hypothetical protein TNCT_12091 [Trichonephila clavata]|uniref:Uncharacterized protein n=1 Tax=Trichonephila clavata TaxID=2740835 RepID=A0A8X6KB52_TRICU|nr:hypothetical protein TNCT_12091 [Trichonephila clavata]
MNLEDIGIPARGNQELCALYTHNSFWFFCFLLKASLFINDSDASPYIICYKPSICYSNDKDKTSEALDRIKMMLLNTSRLFFHWIVDLSRYLDSGE